jgi:hypothetical protein
MSLCSLVKHGLSPHYSQVDSAIEQDERWKTADIYQPAPRDRDKIPHGGEVFHIARSEKEIYLPLTDGTRQGVGKERRAKCS